MCLQTLFCTPIRIAKLVVAVLVLIILAGAVFKSAQFVSAVPVNYDMRTTQLVVVMKDDVLCPDTHETVFCVHPYGATARNSTGHSVPLGGFTALYADSIVRTYISSGVSHTVNVTTVNYDIVENSTTFSIESSELLNCNATCSINYAISVARDDAIVYVNPGQYFPSFPLIISKHISLIGAGYDSPVSENSDNNEDITLIQVQSATPAVVINSGVGSLHTDVSGFVFSGVHGDVAIATNGSTNQVLISNNLFINTKVLLTGNGSPESNRHSCARYTSTSIQHSYWNIRSNVYKSSLVCSSGHARNYWIKQENSIFTESYIQSNKVMSYICRSYGIGLNNTDNMDISNNTFSGHHAAIETSGMQHDMKLERNRFFGNDIAWNPIGSGSTMSISASKDLPLNRISFSRNLIDGGASAVKFDSESSLRVFIEDLKIANNIIYANNTSPDYAVIDLRIKSTGDAVTTAHAVLPYIECRASMGALTKIMNTVVISSNRITVDGCTDAIAIAGKLNTVSTVNNTITAIGEAECTRNGVSVNSESSVYGSIGKPFYLTLRSSNVSGWDNGIIVLAGDGQLGSLPFYGWINVMKSNLYDNSDYNIVSSKTGNSSLCGKIRVTSTYLGSSNYTEAISTISVCRRSVHLLSATDPMRDFTLMTPTGIISSLLRNRFSFVDYEEVGFGTLYAVAGLLFLFTVLTLVSIFAQNPKAVTSKTD